MNKINGMTTLQQLESDLLTAHNAGDDARLSELYEQAAQLVGEDADRASFYLTQAYVFALSSGSPKARDLNARLVALNRDHDASDHL